MAAKKMRKIVQIVAVAAWQGGPGVVLFALCDDGTVWFRDNDSPCGWGLEPSDPRTPSEMVIDAEEREAAKRKGEDEDMK